MNSKSNQPKESRSSRRFAIIATLMMTCVVTLIGVAKGLEPDVILVRCIVAGSATGIATALATALFSTFTSNQIEK